jgi:hypothetical protein
MARPLRVEFDGAVYHVMSRGIEGRSIVLGDEDRDGWLDTLARTAERFGWKLKWSSYRCYHRPALRPEWLDCAGVLSEFGREEVAKSLKADTSRWEPGRRIDDPARSLCAYAVRRVTGARLSELAKALGYRSPSAVTSACRRAEEAMRSDRVRRQVEKLVADAATKR